jgi:molybdopterin-binding protein
LLTVSNIFKKNPGFDLRGISFEVLRGDYFMLLGESGAGKSMVLETIAGLVAPDSGSIMLNGRDITRAKIQDRGVGLVFQDHAVFPHMTVYENMHYAMHGSSLSRQERKKLIGDMAGHLGIAPLLHRQPGTLSGGELQRVALARTLIQKPQLLLLDEPLASLDTRLKSELRALLRQIHREGQTILHVTHDYEEALSLGTRVAVIDHGEIVQQGSPMEVFNAPRSEFVARFTGIRNYFPATLTRQNGIETALVNNKLAFRTVSNEPEGEGFLLIGGEEILLSMGPVETSATNNFEGVVTDVIPAVNGAEVTINIGIPLRALVTPESVARLRIAEGKNLWIHVKGVAVKFITR